jgi:hypothetical protein
VGRGRNAFRISGGTRDLYTSFNGLIDGVVKYRRSQWTGYVAGVGKIRKERRISVEKPHE